MDDRKNGRALDTVELRSPMEEFDDLMEDRMRRARRRGRDDEAELLDGAWELGRRLLAGEVKPPCD